MNKSAYLKTVEVIIAAVLLLGVFVHVNENILRGEELTEKPSRLRNFGEGIMDTYHSNGILKETIGDFKVSEFQEVLYHTLPTNIESSLKVTYLESVRITNRKDSKNRNISLSYNFPKFVDKDSIEVRKGDKKLPLKPVFRWYRIPISFRSNLSEIRRCKVGLNNIVLETEEGKPKRKSVTFYLGERKRGVEVEEWEEVNTNKAMANLTLDLGEMDPGSLEEGHIYFTNNRSEYEREELELEENVNIEEHVSTIQRAPRADLLFRANLTPGKNTKLDIRYKVGTEERSHWEDIENGSRESLEYTYEDRLKTGSMKSNPSKISQESVKISKKFNDYILTINLWYYD